MNDSEHESADDSDADPTYTPRIDSSSDSDADNDVFACPKRPSPSYDINDDELVPGTPKKTVKRKRWTASEVLEKLATAKRPKKECQICHAKVISLDRHLTKKHNITQSYRVCMPTIVTQKESKSKVKRKFKICPICKRVVKRLDHHLASSIHSLSKDSAEYKKYLSEAKPYIENAQSSIDQTDHASHSSTYKDPVQDLPNELYEDQEVLLKRYQTYATSFEGGTMTIDQASKHIFQINRIIGDIRDINNATPEIAKLINRKKSEKIWRPTTCKTYLASLKKFISFFKSSAVIGNVEFARFDSAKLTIMEEKIDTWTSSLHRDIVKERKEKDKNLDPDSLVNPDDIAVYFEGERAEQAKNMLVKEQKVVTKKEHTIARNFIMFSLVVSNCHRTGVFINMTLDELKKAKKKTGSFIVLVKEHKLANYSGPAECVVIAQLYTFIQHYVDWMRPKTDTCQVFASWQGRRMDSGAVIHGLSTELGYIGVQKKMTCTAVRHLGSSLVSAVLTADDRKDLAALMGHSEATQQNVYNNCMASGKNVRISNILRKILSSETVTSEDLEQAEFDYPGYDVRKIKITTNNNESTPAVSVPLDNDYVYEGVDDSGPLLDDYLDETPGTSSCSTPRSADEDVDQEEIDTPTFKECVRPAGRGNTLSQWEVNFLMKHFSHLVLQKEGVRLDQVRAVYNSTGTVRTYAKFKWKERDEIYTCHRIRDILRTYQRDRSKKAMAKKMAC